MTSTAPTRAAATSALAPRHTAHSERPRPMRNTHPVAAHSADPDDQAAARPAAAEDRTGQAAVLTTVLFVIGCALLVGCAVALDKLGTWSADYGRVWVFLGFFLVMSVGGRWFWTGADTSKNWVATRFGRTDR